ncbi:MAG: nucleotide sugar dehydrogenase [Candidatus Heimdallarchaeota archaeon]|nr:nucleotide sugar dehydrogenase [Candidatus Heimdallarchaeota archaeon]
MRYFLSSLEEAQQKLSNKQLKVAVIGQGKMGLPISVILLNTGYTVVGVDINQELVDKINEGVKVLPEEPGVDDGIKLGIEQGKYICSTDLQESIAEADILLIIIPLILDDDKNPHLEHGIELMKNIGTSLTEGQLVITETTLPIGTTNGIFKPILEKESGLTVGKDFGLGFSPERTYSGRVILDVVENYPKIVGGTNKKTTDRMASFYETFALKGTIMMSSTTAAEAVKVFKGAYRDVNIAIANELAKIADAMELDFYEIREAINSEPEANILKTGAGVGGHCIPVYPHFLIKNAKDKGIDAKLISSGREVNTKMPDYIVSKLESSLKQLGKKIEDSKIVLLGLAYRGNVKEHRYSPSLDVIKLLKDRKSVITLNDPLYTSGEINEITDVSFQKDSLHSITNADAIILLTDHHQYKSLKIKDFDDLASKPYVLFDTRNMIEEEEIVDTTKRIILRLGKQSS